MISAFAATVMLPESIVPEPKFKLVPVAAPMFGVTNVKLSLTFKLPLPLKAIVLSSTLTLNCPPTRFNAAEPLAVYAPAPENCVQLIASVSRVGVPFDTTTQPVSAYNVPSSTNVNVPPVISPVVSASVARDHAPAAAT